MLEVGIQTTIQTLFKKGYSKAHISRVLEVSPKPIRKVLKSQEAGESEIQKKPHPSVLDQHQDFIMHFEPFKKLLFPSTGTADRHDHDFCLISKLLERIIQRI